MVGTRRRERAGAVGLALAMALAVAGCGEDGADPGPEQAEVTLSEEGEAVTITSRDGALRGRFGEGTQLPEGFPDDVPLPDGVELTGAMVSTETGSAEAMLSLRSERAVEDLVSAFRVGLENQGWTAAEEVVVMGQRILEATKDGRSLTLQAMPRDDGTHAMVLVAGDG